MNALASNQVIIPKTKLFGKAASRVSSQQMLAVFKELRNNIGDLFVNMSLTKWLPAKNNHGDIDICALLPQKDGNWKLRIVERLGDQITTMSSNGHTTSMLYKSHAINLQVHVDLIVTSNPDVFSTRLQYYSYNDFSGIIGIFSKKLNFHYGSEQFSKIFTDKKGNNHRIFISHNLFDGLKILGYTNVEHKYNDINNVDDIVSFVIDTPLMDIAYFQHNALNQSDKKSLKRPIIDYCVNEIRESNVHRTITDNDYFFKKIFPDIFNAIESEKTKINSNIYMRGKYNGQWLMTNFDLRSGPQIGQILKNINNKFGNELEFVPEKELLAYVQTIRGIK